MEYNNEVEKLEKELFLKLLSKPLDRFFDSTTIPTVVSHMNATFEAATNAVNTDDDNSRMWDADELAERFSHHAALLNFVTEVGTLHQNFKSRHRLQSAKTE
jgi:hypothetical protein